MHGKDAVLSSLKKAADRDGIILRLFNASEEESRAVLNFGIPIAAAYRTNLNEEILEELAPKGHRLRLRLRPCGIETVLVKLHRPERWAERIRRTAPERTRGRRNE